MIPIVINASAYELNANACSQLIMKWVKSASTFSKTVIIDALTLQKSKLSESEQNFPISLIKIADWITEKKPQTVTIRSDANGLSKNQVIMLDARYHDIHIITSVLHEVSLIWFHLKNWQPAFIVIVEDYDTPMIARILSETFYIQPLSTSKKSIQKEIQNVHRHILAYRWLGFGRISRFIQLIQKFVLKLSNYVLRKIS